MRYPVAGLKKDDSRQYHNVRWQSYRSMTAWKAVFGSNPQKSARSVPGYAKLAPAAHGAEAHPLRPRHATMASAETRVWRLLNRSHLTTRDRLEFASGTWPVRTPPENNADRHGKVQSRCGPSTLVGRTRGRRGVGRV